MRRTVIVILVVCILLALILFGISTETKKTFTVEWLPYAGSSSGVTGYLYELKHIDGRYGVYISTDRELTKDNTKLGEGWLVEMVGMEELWNPRICAKMPLTISGKGDILMYETERRSVGQFTAKLIWFEKSTANIFETPFSFGEFVGRYLFTDEQNKPYFITLQDHFLSKYVIDTYSSALTQESISTLLEDEVVTLELRDVNAPLLKFYSKSTLVSELFALTGTALTPLLEIPESSIWRREADLYNVYGLGLGFEARYRPDGPYETAIIYEDQSILSFVPEFKVYSYVLGAYQSK